MSTRFLLEQCVRRCHCPPARHYLAPLCPRRIAPPSHATWRRFASSATATQTQTEQWEPAQDNVNKQARNSIPVHKYVQISNEPAWQKREMGIAHPEYYPDPKNFQEDRLKRVTLGQDPEQDVTNLQQEMVACARRGDAAVYNYVEMLLRDYHVPPNRQMYRALVMSCTMTKTASAALLRSYVEEMQEEGIELDSSVCHDILAALAVHPDQFLLDAILSHMEEDSIKLSAEGHNLVSASLLRDQQFELALQRLDFMSREGIPILYWLQDMLFYAFVEIADRDMTELFNIIKTRHQQNLPPVSKAMWITLLDIGTSKADHQCVKYAWDRQVRSKYINPSIGVCNNALVTAARAGDADLATDVFRLLTERKVPLETHQYELLVETMLKASDLRTAIGVYSVMQTSGIIPTTDCTRPLFVYLRDNPQHLSHALDILHQQLDGPAPMILAVINTIIEAHCALHDITAALDVFNSHLRTLHPSGPDAQTYNTLLKGIDRDTKPLLDVGRTLTLNLAAQMHRDNISPDASTYNYLIINCIKQFPLEGYNEESILAREHLRQSPPPLDADAWRYFTEARLREILLPQRAWRLLMRRLTDAKDERIRQVWVELLRLVDRRKETGERWFVPKFISESKVRTREVFGELTVRRWVAEDRRLSGLFDV